MKPYSIIFLCLWMLSLHAQSTPSWDSLTQAYRFNNIQGAILVARGDSILYNNAWGYADMDNHTKLRPNTLFKTESTGKMFTATAIMQLVELGQLSLQSTVREHLPLLPLKNAEKMTIHHLLTHTSGLASPWDASEYDFKRAYSRTEMEQIISDMPLVFDTPGKEMYYSNSGYIILSWIVEKITGISFDEYLASHFFTSRQMKTIRHLNDTVMPPGEAQPYRFLNSKRYMLQNETVSPKANGAGGWIASATDLYHFMLGLDTDKFISPKTLLTMRTANGAMAIDSTFQGYAYGLEVFNNDPVNGVSYFGHSGGGGGFSIDAILDPVSHIIVIFCSNTYTNSREVSSNFLRLALNKPLKQIILAGSIRIYDLIELTGIAGFLENEKNYFRELGITADERLFIRVSDAMAMAQDYDNLKGWADLGIRYFPQNGFLYLMKGSAFAKLGEKENAVTCFNTAREIAAKNQDVRMLEETEQRLSMLQ